MGSAESNRMFQSLIARNLNIQTLGKVYLIGAGPGDPGLITVKGLKALQQAEVVVYDYLVNPLFLEEVQAGAEIIYVGKKAGCHTVSQEGINELLVCHARQGKVVARLKGGDPFVFGRGAEEAQELRAAGIPFEVIPGISSAIAVPAYAGIPVTHRDYASSFTVVTGHENPKRPLSESRINWQGLAQIDGTVVFLMGVGNLAEISRNLVDAGQSPFTPVAVIEWGTMAEQRTITGDLTTIAELAILNDIKAPAVIVVGQVVNLQPQLQWFEFPQLVCC